jgi:DNA-binding response OmpR family regulator
MGFLKRITIGKGKLKYPVLVLTAKTAMEDFFEDMEVEGFLPKPCPEAELARKIREILSRRAAQVRAAARGGRRILVVENDLPMLSDLETVMAAAGYEVDTADSAHEVLERATTARPDAILMKEALPKMPGTLIASLLGAMPSTRGIPVVLYDPGNTIASAPENRDDKLLQVVRTSDASELLGAVERILGIG